MNTSFPRELLAVAALTATFGAVAGPVFPDAAKPQVLYDGGNFTEGV